jgi:hypothetical protein
MPFLLPALAFAPFLGVFVSFSSASTSLSSSSPPAHPRVLLYTDFSPKKKNSAVAPWWVTDGDTWQDTWDREVRERLRQVCQSSGFTLGGGSPPNVALFGSASTTHQRWCCPPQRSRQGRHDPQGAQGAHQHLRRVE